MHRLGHFDFCFPVIFVVAFAGVPGFGQGEAEPRGFGDIQLGAPVSTIPFPCNHPVECEAPDESIWVRIWHGDGRIRRVDVIYNGKAMDFDEEIRSSPVTLPQAIRSHSIRYGRKAPRLAYGGSEAGSRIIVDTANAIAYFAEGISAESRVKEVRYLPLDDSLIVEEGFSPLTGQGKWLVKAAWSAPRYKNLQADPEPTEAVLFADEYRLNDQELSARLQRLSSQEKSFALTTRMLSERVSESLKRHEEPDAVVAANLEKAYALLSATEKEATFLINDHPDAVTAEEIQAVRLDVAEEADRRMQELAGEGFVE